MCPVLAGKTGRHRRFVRFDLTIPFDVETSERMDHDAPAFGDTKELPSNTLLDRLRRYSRVTEAVDLFGLFLGVRVTILPFLSERRRAST